MARMAHGQIFGTDVLQGDGRRTATVRAVGEVRLLGIAREELQTLLPYLSGLRGDLELPADAQAYIERFATVNAALPEQQ